MGEARAAQETAADNEAQHQWYGPCDSMGPRGECSECKRVEMKDEEAFELWLRGARPAIRARLNAATPLPASHERLAAPDWEWALDRVRRMQGCAELNAGRLGTKLLRGHGYPDEIMRDAQDALALSIVLAALSSPLAPATEPQEGAGE